MTGLIDTNTGLADGVNLGLIWLLGGLGEADDITPLSAILLDRFNEEILDRFGSPIQARSTIPNPTTDMMDRSGAEMFDRGGNLIMTRV